jgi:hypothetical protein
LEKRNDNERTKKEIGNDSRIKCRAFNVFFDNIKRADGYISNACESFE